MDTTSARVALAAWKDSFPADPFTADRHLRSILRRSLEPDRLAALEVRASAFARTVTGVVGPAAARYEHRAHLPELARYDAIGREPSPWCSIPPTTRPAEAVWASGLVALSGTPGERLRAGHPALPALPRGRGRARLPGHLHHRARPRPAPGRRSRGRATGSCPRWWTPSMPPPPGARSS